MDVIVLLSSFDASLSGLSLGIVLAVVAAVAFAFHFLSVRLGTQDGDVVGVMFISLVVNVFVVVPLVVAIYPRPYIALFTPMALVSFAAAGVFGSLVARFLMFRSIEVIGASRTSPIISANVFFASGLAILFLDEVLTIFHFLGIVLIVAGVAIISWETASSSDPDQSLREIGLSLLLPLAAAASIGFEPVFIALGLAEGTPVLPGVAVIALTATLGFSAYILFRSTFRVPFRSRIFVWYVGAGLTSSVGIILYLAALQIAPVVVVVPILQLAPLFVLVLSAIFLPQRLERVTPRLVGAAVVVVVGATVVTLSG